MPSTEPLTAQLWNLGSDFQVAMEGNAEEAWPMIGPPARILADCPRTTLTLQRRCAKDDFFDILPLVVPTHLPHGDTETQKVVSKALSRESWGHCALCLSALRRHRTFPLSFPSSQSMLPSTPCWIRSTLVWITWRRRMTTSMPASRSCWSLTDRHAWNSSNSLGRPPVMPAPRCQEPPTRPHPCLSRPCSGPGRCYLA